MKTILHQLTGGLKSSMGYVGCNNLENMKKNTRFIKISSSDKETLISPFITSIKISSP